MVQERRHDENSRAEHRTGQSEAAADGIARPRSGAPGPHAVRRRVVRLAADLRVGHRARRGGHRRRHRRDRPRARPRLSPALASVLPARGALLGASRRRARSAAAPPRRRTPRCAARRAHASSHRPRRRPSARDRQPRVGGAGGIRTGDRHRRPRARLSAAPLAEMVAARIHPLRSTADRAVRRIDAVDAARRRRDCADAWSYPAPRLGCRLRRSDVVPRRRHQLQRTAASRREGGRRQSRSPRDARHSRQDSVAGARAAARLSAVARSGGGRSACRSCGGASGRDLASARSFRTTAAGRHARSVVAKLSNLFS